MATATRTILGYAALGLLIGTVLFPWFYLWSVRTKNAALTDPTWLQIYFAIFLVPALVLALVGWNRSKTPTV